MKLRPASKLPDPWLFDSEKLLNELDRIREMVLIIPATTHETHMASNNAISSIWNLQTTLRYLLGLHRDGQRQFAKKSDPMIQRTASRERSGSARQRVV